MSRTHETREQLPSWCAHPQLRPVWERIRDRFEKEGLEAHGRVRVVVDSREGRHALGELLGRTVVLDHANVDLTELDQRLADRSGIGGLDAVLTAVFGTPPTDRPARRAAARAAREEPLVLAAELVNTSWSPQWVAQLRRLGLLTGRADATELVTSAAVVLNHLTPHDEGSAPPAPAWPGAVGTRSRVELAARLLGDAHGLDPDTVLHRVVLHGLAAASAQQTPDGARDRDALWARYGIAPDLLSRTCLVWRLRAHDSGPLTDRLDLAHASGDPVHVTDWDVRRAGGLRLSCEEHVLVCENPRVLEAFAEQKVPGWTVVCTAGEPNLIVRSIVDALASSVGGVRYHGDFDWGGIRIADRLIDPPHLVPWLMEVDDYLAALRPDGPPLVGTPVEPSWSPELGAAMRAHGRAVHEESTLTRMLVEARRV